MLFTDIIRRKRSGDALADEEIEFFAAGLADGSLPAEQVAALAMAVFFQSMSFREAGVLTRAMARSGQMLHWDADALGGPVIDKHSTGGVGDKVSFLLAPIAAAIPAPARPVTISAVSTGPSSRTVLAPTSRPM